MTRRKITEQGQFFRVYPSIYNTVVKQVKYSNDSFTVHYDGYNSTTNHVPVLVYLYLEDDSANVAKFYVYESKYFYFCTFEPTVLTNFGTFFHFTYTTSADPSTTMTDHVFSFLQYQYHFFLQQYLCQEYIPIVVLHDNFTTFYKHCRIHLRQVYSFVERFSCVVECNSLIFETYFLYVDQIVYVLFFQNTALYDEKLQNVT